MSRKKRAATKTPPQGLRSILGQYSPKTSPHFPLFSRILVKRLQIWLYEVLTMAYREKEG
jgi:hypothetical protein